ncbi:hypothetical protein Dimus_034939 [Dionaea muscipula]
MISSFLGGRNPFDDPFFTRPFGSPFGSLFTPGFPPGMFGSVASSPFGNSPADRFLEHQQPQPNKRKGPIIEELNSDDEQADGDSIEGKKENARKHGRSEKEPYVEDPDDVAQERKNQRLQYGNMYNGMNNMQPQPQSRSFSFQSSTVTYGGVNGAYYTKSTTRKAGSDGVSFEELKEADSSTGQATHRISRGLNDKGHTLTRKLNSDGRVDSLQALHNLNEDELPEFEESWEGSADQHLPGWRQRLEGHGSFGSSSSNSRNGQPIRGGGWALPSSQHTPPQQQMVNPPAIAYARGPTPNSQPHGRRNASNGSRGRMRA